MYFHQPDTSSVYLYPDKTNVFLVHAVVVHYYVIIFMESLSRYKKPKYVFSEQFSTPPFNHKRGLLGFYVCYDVGACYKPC